MTIPSALFIIKHPLTDDNMLITMNDYGLLKVHGPDAGKFLQGQLTCDVDSVTTAHSTLGAHCNPQGRVISLFQLFHHDQAYYLLLPQSMLPIAAAALKKYIVFFKASLDDASTQIATIVPHEPWRYFNVHEGIPSIYPETSGQFLPHELNLPALGAVSFNKGCFTGQEIIARMQYRGKLKKRMQHASIKCETDLSLNTKIYLLSHHQKQEAGIIIDHCNEQPIQHLLLLTDDVNVKNHHLFIETPDQHFIIFS